MDFEAPVQPQRNARGIRTRRFLLITALVAVGSVAAFLLWQRVGPASRPQFGVVVDAATPIKDFRLSSTRGQPLALSDLEGKYVAVYFGYTTCPDICPTTLADLGQALQLMGDKADRLQVLFVTVDPERDTVDRMREYLAYFSPSIVGLSGSLEETESIASQFGVVYEKRFTENSATDYLMDHSSFVVVLDPERRPKLMFPFGVTGEQIASDLRLLIQ